MNIKRQEKAKDMRQMALFTQSRHSHPTIIQKLDNKQERHKIYTREEKANNIRQMALFTQSRHSRVACPTFPSKYLQGFFFFRLCNP